MIAAALYPRNVISDPGSKDFNPVKQKESLIAAACDPVCRDSRNLEDCHEKKYAA
jgi:hypothetical protein